MLLVAPVGTEKPLPMQGSQKQEQAQPKTDTANPAAPGPCASEVCKENAANAERYAYYKAHPKEYLKAAVAPANLSNWVLAGLGVIGGILALFTLSTIKAQTSHLVTSERPWMVVQMLGAPQMYPDSGLVGAICKLENCGRSIAHIIEIGNAIEVLEKGVALPEKFPKFDARSFCRWEGNGVPLFPESNIQRSAVKETLNPNAAAEVFSGEQVFWFYGYVKYHDAFVGRRIFRRPWRETRYCFKWQHPRPDVGIEGEFFLEGPPAYNRAT